MNELRIQQVAFSGDEMSVTFSDELCIVVPIICFPRLNSATEIEREDWTLIGRGLGVHWESVDEDLSVENILTAYSRSRNEIYAALPQV
jgi:hypothetical protein